MDSGKNEIGIQPIHALLFSISGFALLNDFVPNTEIGFLNIKTNGDSSFTGVLVLISIPFFLLALVISLERTFSEIRNRSGQSKDVDGNFPDFVEGIDPGFTYGEPFLWPHSFYFKLFAFYWLPILFAIMVFILFKHESAYVMEKLFSWTMSRLGN